MCTYLTVFIYDYVFMLAKHCTAFMYNLYVIYKIYIYLAWNQVKNSTVRIFDRFKLWLYADGYHVAIKQQKIEIIILLIFKQHFWLYIWIRLHFFTLLLSIEFNCFVELQWCLIIVNIFPVQHLRRSKFVSVYDIRSTFIISYVVFSYFIHFSIRY